MKILIVYILILINAGTAYTQSPKTTNMILIVDNEVPCQKFKGVMRLADSANIKIIPFEYKVGILEVTDDDYEYIFARKVNQITICFQINDNTEYIINMPGFFINKNFIIIQIYNKADPLNKKKYFYQTDQSYVYKITVPGNVKFPLLLRK